MNLKSRPRPELAIVTGSAGYVGSKLADSLVSEAGLFTIAIDRVVELRKDPAIRVLQCDLADFSSRETVSALGPAIENAAIFHLAGLFVKDPGSSFQVDPGEYEKNNLLATRNLVDSILDSGHRPYLFVFASSACVYDGSIEQPTPVGRARPTTAYGESKFLAEREVERLRGWARNVFVLRFSRVLGLGSGEFVQQDVISDFIRRFAHADIAVNSTLIGSASEVRSYIHINDLINCLLSLLSRNGEPECKTSNLTTVRPVRIGDIGEVVAETLNSHLLLRNPPRPKIRSWVRTRVPVLFPEPDPGFVLNLADSVDVVRHAANEYCYHLKQLLESGRVQNLLAAIDQFPNSNSVKDVEINE